MSLQKKPEHKQGTTPTANPTLATDNTELEKKKRGWGLGERNERERDRKRVTFHLSSFLQEALWGKAKRCWSSRRLGFQSQRYD